MRPLVLAALLLGWAAAAPADERQGRVDEFNRMIADSRKKGQLLNNGPAEPAKENMVKVWASLYKPKANAKPPFAQGDFQATGQHVSLGTYVWQPGEAYRLCFQPGKDVYLGYYNVKNGAAHGETLLPDADYPETLVPIKAGHTFEMPIVFTTDKNAAAREIVWLLFAADGNPKLPKKGGGDIGVLGPKLNELRDDANKRGARFSGLLADKPPKNKSQNIGDVATIVKLNNDHTGILEIEFKK